MNYYVNPNFTSVERVFPYQNRYGYIRLDMNENPEGLPEELVQKVLKRVNSTFLSTYPEPDVFLRKYANSIGIDEDNLMVTNGSDMGIRYIFETFGKPNSEVVTVSPSFEMYWVNCKLTGVKHIPVSYNNDFSISVQNILEAINENTSIVVMLNPNNPIGNAYKKDEVISIIEKAKKCNSIVLIDEAYHYFYAETFLDLALNYKNVIVLRTFSKIYSLAACRLGVVISNNEIIRYLKQSKLSFEVNSFALLFGEAIVEEDGLLDYLIETAREGKEYVLNALCECGYECKTGLGNFIFVKPNMAPKEIEKKLREQKKILVHSFSHPLLKDYLRITTGSIRIMKIFVDALLDVDKKMNDSSLG